MDISKLLDHLEDHFENNGWPLDMDDEKLQDRAFLSEEQYKAGWGIIKIERHRAVLGASYHRGQPMSAFQTYWMRYAVHQETGEVEELPDENGEICIDDMDNLVDATLSDSISFSIEPTKSGKYLISETTNKYKREISSFEEAKAFAIELANESGEFFQEMIDNEGVSMPDEQRKQLCDEYKECVRRWVVNKIEDLWEERER